MPALPLQKLPALNGELELVEGDDYNESPLSLAKHATAYVQNTPSPSPSASSPDSQSATTSAGAPSEGRPLA